ncbi:MAG: hypothetical protein QM793_01330 [Muricomes sp.]
MIQAINKKNIGEFVENLYLLLFVLMISYYFLHSTTFVIDWPQYFYENLRIFLIVTIVVKAVVDEDSDYINVILGALTAIVLLIAWKHNGYQELSDAVLLIVGCRGISFRKIVKVYVITCGVLLFYTMASALTGKIENFILHQEGRRTRISFGIVYPTDFSAYVFYLILAYCYLRRAKIKYMEIAATTMVGICVYVFCDAKLNTICILLTAGIMAYNKIRHDKAIKKQKDYNMAPIFSIFLCLSTTLAAILMIVLTRLYSSNNELILLLNRVLTNRLMLGKRGIDLYGLSIFGQGIPMIGSGNSNAQPKNYFFLDSSYLFVLLQYGILVLGIILLLFLVMSFRARKERDWTLLWIIALMSLQCMVEHHMMNVSYNFLLSGTLAYLGKNVQVSQGIKPMIKNMIRKGKQHGKI